MGLDWAWDAFDVADAPKVWAFSATTVFLVGWLAVNICFFRQQSLKQRADDCEDAKKKLEDIVGL